MNLQIVSVHNPGNYDREYVILKVVADCNVGRFLLAASHGSSEDGVLKKLGPVFWIPDKDVKRGNLVTVWTKRGTDTFTAGMGVMYHFYWGLPAAIWHDPADSPVLLELTTWQFCSTREDDE